MDDCMAARICSCCSLRYSSTVMPSRRAASCGSGNSSRSFAEDIFNVGNRCEARIESGIVNRIRMQLLIDPFLQAHFLDALEIARARTKAQTIERLQNGFVFGQLLGGQSLQCF